MSSSPRGLGTFNELVSSLRIRIARWVAPARSAPRPTASPAFRRGDSFRDRPRVLVVDDRPENRLMLEAMLLRWSICPVHAADGAQAVALARAQQFDLILMDLQMPIVDGMTATVQIRDFEGRNDHPRAPIVAHSSLTLEDEWPILRACGFDESLDKPCSSRSLEECLQRWCGTRLSQAVTP